ncbi:hypothetical protein GMSM_07920 [Geomonas sp. Red276]
MKRLLHTIIAVAFFCVPFLSPAPVRASELYALGGLMESSDPTAHSYSWQLEYRQDLLKHLAAGTSYLNEGHIDGHHRDGYTVQFWGRTELLDYRLTLAAAVGPYFYLDTKREPTPKGFSNDHGMKAMMSLAAAWHFDNDLIFELRSNWVKAGSSFDTLSVLGGIGYHFDPNLEPVSVELARSEELKNEITFFLGQTIVNSLNSQHSIAAAVEYRRRLSRHVDWTLEGLYEGDNRLVRRDGLITQIWASQPLLEGLFSVAGGAGPYFDIGHYHRPADHEVDPVGLLLTITGSYRFTPHWFLRASWNRLVTSNDRDTDIILGGLGFRF